MGIEGESKAVREMGESGSLAARGERMRERTIGGESA